VSNFIDLFAMSNWISSLLTKLGHVADTFLIFKKSFEYVKAIDDGTESIIKPS